MTENTKCQNCGADLLITDRFCSQCGTKHEIIKPTTPCDENEVMVARSLAMLDSMEGLEAVKNEIKEVVEFVKKDKVRSEMMGYPTRFPHKYLFIGNPCTGRTTVARLLANILHELGVMPDYKMIAVWSKALIGNNPGQSTAKVRNAVESAIGGVLFIDDAHLFNQPDDVMVQEAVYTLINELANHRDDLVCIAAGTPVEMKQMLTEYPKLHERFDRELIFER